MNNTTRYRLSGGAGPELKFDTYFQTDGSVTASVEKLQGFWHVNRANQFCYALYGIPGALPSLIECFPIEAMSIPRFREELWRTQPAPGFTLVGGIVAGRPSTQQGADAHPGYWDNLFKNTIRYEVATSAGKQVIDLWFNADKSVTSNTAAKGTWVVEGDEGKEEMCYSIRGVTGIEGALSECFKLVLMYNRGSARAGLRSSRKASVIGRKWSRAASSSFSRARHAALLHGLPALAVARCTDRCVRPD